MNELAALAEATGATQWKAGENVVRGWISLIAGNPSGAATLTRAGIKESHSLVVAGRFEQTTDSRSLSRSDCRNGAEGPPDVPKEKTDSLGLLLEYLGQIAMPAPDVRQAHKARSHDPNV